MNVRSASTRSSGILLHPTSLPGPFGMGDLGPAAHRFLATVGMAGQRWWQMLPVGPTGYGDSPYQALSSFAGNTLLLSPEALADRGLLGHRDIDAMRVEPAAAIDFTATTSQKRSLTELAAHRFGESASPTDRDRFLAFRDRVSGWLAEYGLYVALKRAHGLRPWPEWDSEVARRDGDALAAARRALHADIEMIEIAQFLFFEQWSALREAASGHGIGLVGDLPLFVAHDSADVWAHQDLFRLDPAGMPTHVAGVPPDYFSELGQRWGNPLYNWTAMEGGDFAWWRTRLRHVTELFDIVRIDHFRGLAAYWEIPADEPTAVRGRWLEAPGRSLLTRTQRDLGAMPFLAEDLGVITEDVTALRQEFGLPGMRVAQFGFDTEQDAALHDPAVWTEDVWGYTATHDNDTTLGWFWRDNPGHDATLLAPGRQRLTDLVGYEDIAGGLIQVVFRSAAAVVVVPMQDILRLGSEARMNTPGTEEGNWRWRLMPGQWNEERAFELAGLSAAAGRTWPPC